MSLQTPAWNLKLHAELKIIEKLLEKEGMVAKHDFNHCPSNKLGGSLEMVSDAMPARIIKKEATKKQGYTQVWD